MQEIVMKIWEMPILINCFSLAILLIFLMDNRRKHHDFKTQRYFFFQHMVVSNILLLVFDGISWLAVGNPDPTMRTVHILSTTVYYILTPLPSFFFVCFADVVLGISAEKRTIRTRLYLVPVVLHFLFAVATPFTGWFYQIDAANQYHRGSLLALSFILSFMLMVVAFFRVLVRYLQSRRGNDEMAKNIKEYSWMVKFTFIPIIGGFVQAFFYNVTYIWNITVIALLVLYINYQNAEITTDSLTGLYNRRQAYGYFDRFVREQEREKGKLAVVMVDINNFKSINDRYGHSLGDKAIIAVARCLESVFSLDDFVCRFGGDEFLIITKHGKASHLAALMQTVNGKLQTLQDKGEIPFSLSVSSGYALYSKKNRTLDAAFTKADEMMFKQKAKLKRRSDDRQPPGRD